LSHAAAPTRAHACAHTHTHTHTHSLNQSINQSINQSQVQKKTVDACRSYLELPHFNRDVIFTKSHAAAGLCDWAVNIVKYYDVVSEVRGPKVVRLWGCEALAVVARTGGRTTGMLKRERVCMR
jgi:hypothetical protein